MSSNSSEKFTGNDDYQLMIEEVEKVRDCVAGQFFVKLKGEEYLPHPSAVDKTSQEQRMRYKQYIDNAEFDEFTDNTERVMIGKLKVDDTEVDIPEKLSYLIEDCDNDGLPLTGLIESSCKNALEVKWHLLLSDYQGLSDLDVDSLTIADLERANPRATIKQYTRENVIDWAFSRVGGKMQMTYALLRESSKQTDPETMSEIDVTSWLKLGIDEVGYYQQKYVYGAAKGEQIEGEKNYVSVNGKALQYIPVAIASDEELPSGTLPLKLGFLDNIANLALARYRTNAKYKEALDGLQPMINIYGVDESDWEEYKTINGRTYAAVGVSSPNVWPSPDTKVEMLNANAAFEPWEREFEKNTKTVQALGGVFKTDVAVQRTATEIISEVENQVAVLDPLVNSVARAVQLSVWYCGVFEGIFTPDNMSQMDQVNIEMPKDFATTRLSPEEVASIRDTYLAGLYSKEEAVRLLVMGGRSTVDAEALLGQLDEGI